MAAIDESMKTLLVQLSELDSKLREAQAVVKQIDTARREVQQKVLEMYHERGIQEAFAVNFRFLMQTRITFGGTTFEQARSLGATSEQKDDELLKHLHLQGQLIPGVKVTEWIRSYNASKSGIWVPNV